jgi:CHASE2 domain-containing sensor protein
VVVVAVTFLIASVLLFTSFHGEMRDVYVKASEMLGVYPAKNSGEVVLVTVGAEALYLWNPADPSPEVTPRDLLAELVRVLDAAEARVIVLDFLFETPSPADPALAAAATSHGAVVTAERWVVTDPSSGARFSPGPAASVGPMPSGLANLAEEPLWTTSEGRLVRALRLVERVNRARLSQPFPASIAEPQGTHEPTPHMALLAAWWQRARTADPAATPETLLARLDQGCRPTCTVTLPDLGLPPGPGLDTLAPVPFRGPEYRDGLATLSAAELLRLAGEPALFRSLGVEAPVVVPPWLRDRVAGKLVVVGRVDERAGDRFATPFSFPFPTTPDMDGARIQAHAIDTLLSGRHVWTVPDWFSGILGASLFIGVWTTARRLREDVHTIVWIGAGIGLVATGILLFAATDGVVLDLTVPLTSSWLGLLAVRLRSWAAD